MAIETDNPFEKVLDRLREKGWRKKDFGEANGPNCIYGAIAEIEVDFHTVDVLVRELVNEQFPDRIAPRLHEGVSFNDHPDTTFTARGEGVGEGRG